MSQVWCSPLMQMDKGSRKRINALIAGSKDKIYIVILCIILCDHLTENMAINNYIHLLHSNNYLHQWVKCNSPSVEIGWIFDLCEPTKCETSDFVCVQHCNSPISIIVMKHLNKIETKIIQRICETKSCFFEEINRIDKP